MWRMEFETNSLKKKVFICFAVLLQALFDLTDVSERWLEYYYDRNEFYLVYKDAVVMI